MKIELVIPVTIDIEAFLLSLKNRFEADVSLEIISEPFPIRRARKKVDQVTVSFFGPDQEIYMKLIEDYLDDFLEASGFVY